jgi:hypothetical protein
VISDAHRPGERDRCGPARRCLAAMPHALRPKSAEPGPEIGPALGGHAPAGRLRTTRHRRRPGPDEARPGRIGGQVPQGRSPLGRRSARPAGVHGVPARAGGRSGPTTRRND